MTLTRGAIDRLAKRYGLGDVGTVSKMAGGMNNDCHRVGTERGDFVFKVLGYDVNSVQLDQRMSEKLDLEFGVLDHLEERGFPTRCRCRSKTNTVIASPGSTGTT